MLTFFITLLTILEVLVCLLLTLLILMQRPRQEGLGAAFGSGMTDQMFGAQTTNVLQRATVYLGAALFALTFVLAILVSKQDNASKTASTLTEPSDKLAKPAAPAASTTPAPAEQKKDDKAAPAPATMPAKPTAEKPAPTKPADSKPAVENKTPVPAKPAPSASTPSAPAPVPTSPPKNPEPAKSGN